MVRRDVAFWRRLAAEYPGRILELGCGTGRIAIPLLRAGAAIVGVDRSQEMLLRARRRAAGASLARRARFVRGDIRALPFRPTRRFDLVMAPYGILQSLTREQDLAATLRSVSQVLRRGGVFGIDLVPDLPRWREYDRKVSMHGRRGRTTLTLIESVRQDRRRKLTTFDQEYVERRGGETRVHRFALSFRTLSVPQMCDRLDTAGFRVRSILGDYRGKAWDPRADVWIILADKR